MQPHDITLKQAEWRIAIYGGSDVDLSWRPNCPSISLPLLGEREDGHTSCRRISLCPPYRSPSDCNFFLLANASAFSLTSSVLLSWP